MTREIIIQAGPVIASAELTENATADAIWEALPLEGMVNRWGDEIYFDIQMLIECSSDARQVMQMGELAYWPGGTAFCIFFGPTPVSQADEPRAYTDVNPFGQMLGNASVFSKVHDGETIKISKAQLE
jgi:hypothetical protein